jgi:hypothetical protein
MSSPAMQISPQLEKHKLNCKGELKHQRYHYVYKNKMFSYTHEAFS